MAIDASEASSEVSAQISRHLEDVSHMHVAFMKEQSHTINALTSQVAALELLTQKFRVKLGELEQSTNHRFAEESAARVDLEGRLSHALRKASGEVPTQVPMQENETLQEAPIQEKLNKQLSPGEAGKEECVRYSIQLSSNHMLEPRLPLPKVNSLDQIAGDLGKVSGDLVLRWDPGLCQELSDIEQSPKKADEIQSPRQDIVLQDQQLTQQDAQDVSYDPDQQIETYDQCTSDTHSDDGARPVKPVTKENDEGDRSKDVVGEFRAEHNMLQNSQRDMLMSTRGSVETINLHGETTTRGSDETINLQEERSMNSAAFIAVPEAKVNLKWNAPESSGKGKSQSPRCVMPAAEASSRSSSRNRAQIPNSGHTRDLASAWSEIETRSRSSSRNGVQSPMDRTLSPRVVSQKISQPGPETPRPGAVRTGTPNKTHSMNSMCGYRPPRVLVSTGQLPCQVKIGMSSPRCASPLNGNGRAVSPLAISSRSIQGNDVIAVLQHTASQPQMVIPSIAVPTPAHAGTGRCAAATSKSQVSGTILAPTMSRPNVSQTSLHSEQYPERSSK